MQRMFGRRRGWF